MADATFWHQLWHRETRELCRVTQELPPEHPLLRGRWRPSHPTYVAFICMSVSQEKPFLAGCVWMHVCCRARERWADCHQSPRSLLCLLSRFPSRPAVTGTFRSEKCEAGLVQWQVIDSRPLIMKSIFIFYLLSRYKDSASVPGNECSLSLSLAWVWKCV